MKSWLCCIGLVAVAVFTSAACSDSSTTGSGGAGGAGGSTGGAGGSGADDGGGGSAGSAPDGGGDATTVACTTVYDNDKIAYTGTGVPVYTCNGSKSTNYPDGPNACRNDSDCAMINTGKVRDLVKTCALGCRSYEPPMGTCDQEAKCNTDCVKMATATNIMQPGISAACGACYTDVALCSVAFCVGECAVDADAIECIKCQFINGCRLPYERCSGLDRQP